MSTFEGLTLSLSRNFLEQRSYPGIVPQDENGFCWERWVGFVSWDLLLTLVSCLDLGQNPPSGPSFHPFTRPSLQELRRETCGNSR